LFGTQVRLDLPGRGRAEFLDGGDDVVDAEFEDVDDPKRRAS